MRIGERLSSAFRRSVGREGGVQVSPALALAAACVAVALRELIKLI